MNVDLSLDRVQHSELGVICLWDSKVKIGLFDLFHLVSFISNLKLGNQILIINDRSIGSLYSRVYEGSRFDHQAWRRTFSHHQPQEVGVFNDCRQRNHGVHETARDPRKKGYPDREDWMEEPYEHFVEGGLEALRKFHGENPAVVKDSRLVMGGGKRKSELSLTFFPGEILLYSGFFKDTRGVLYFGFLHFYLFCFYVFVL